MRSECAFSAFYGGCTAWRALCLRMRVCETGSCVLQNGLYPHRQWCRLHAVFLLSVPLPFCSLTFLFPYLSVPLRFRTRSLHTHYSKHLYAYIPLPDGCRNYKLRHSACTLCFKACGFVINTFFTDRSTGVIPCCPSENQTPASFKKAGVFRAYTLLLSFCSLPIFLQILFCYAFLCCCFCTSVLQQFYLYQYSFILSRAVLTILLSAHRLSNRQSRKIASKTGIQESAPLKIPFHAGTKK